MKARREQCCSGGNWEIETRLELAVTGNGRERNVASATVWVNSEDSASESSASRCRSNDRSAPRLRDREPQTQAERTPRIRRRSRSRMERRGESAYGPIGRGEERRDEWALCELRIQLEGEQSGAERASTLLVLLTAPCLCPERVEPRGDAEMCALSEAHKIAHSRWELRRKNFIQR